MTGGRQERRPAISDRETGSRMATDDISLLFGQLALRDGLITPEQLEEALRLQREAARGQLLGRILVERGYLKETEVARIYQQQIMTRHAGAANGTQVRRAAAGATPSGAAAAAPPVAAPAAATGAPLTQRTPSGVMASVSATPGERTPTGAVSAVSPGEQRLFGKYLLTEVLGRGQSQTFKVWDSDRKSFLALKIGPSAGAPEAEIRRFRQDGEAAAKLSHANIVKVHEVSEIDGRPYVLMDYVMGISLDHLMHPDNRDPADFGTNKGTTRIHRHPKDESLIGEIRKAVKERRPLQLDHLVRLIAEAARAVHHAHENGVVHRNLKPHNIIADLQGRAVITDFASTQFVSQALAAGDDSNASAPPVYVAPELFKGGADVADARGDVYSLGAILYESITARAPYQGTPRQVIDRIARSEPTLPSEIHAGVPPALESICLKAMHRKRDRRYATALEFAEDLDRFLYGGDVRAQSDLGAARVWRRVTGGIFPKLAGSFLALTVVAWVGAGFLPPKTGSDPREAPELQQAAGFAAEAARLAQQPGRAKEVFDLYTRAISLDRGNWQYYHERGLAAYAMGRIDTALKDFKDCIDHGTGADGARYFTGRIRMEETAGAGGRESDTLEIFERLLGYHPDSPFKHLTSARILALKREWDKAGLMLDKADPAFYPGEADAIRGWIQVHREPPDLEGAVRCYSKAIEAAPRDEKFLLARARLLIQMGKFPEARRDLDRAIEISPSHHQLYRERGFLLADHLQEVPQAIEDLEQVVRLMGDQETDFAVRSKINSLRMK